MSSNKEQSIRELQKVFYAIKSIRPELSDDEAQKIVSVVLDQVAKRIGAGDAIAFFHLNENDQAEVITYTIEPKAKGKGG